MAGVQWTVPAVVLDVHDGDTMRVRADLGWWVQIETLVRIDGINADELSTAKGKDARTFALTLVKPGDSVTLVSKKLLGSLEKYGRVLADVALADGRDFAQAVLAAGQAAPWDGSGKKPTT
jgi:endonuclease YncB( thermonuclease family)